MPIVVQKSAHSGFDPCSNPETLSPPVDAASTTAAPAVHGLGCAGPGIVGISRQSVGVSGESKSYIGVFGRCESGDGIQGRTAAPDHAGVSAVNEKNGFGLWASSNGGKAGHFEGGVTVRGDIQVEGGVTVRGDIQAAGNVEANDVNVSGGVTVAGNVEANDVIVSGGDCAEYFDRMPGMDVDPGTLMVIGHGGELVPSSEPYDPRAAGVVSGAGNYKPGITLDAHCQADSRCLIALSGKVYCKIDASYRPVRIGDLLTSSSTPGHAMAVSDKTKAFGAVIGKALGALELGTGIIPIIVSLQ